MAHGAHRAHGGVLGGAAILPSWLLAVGVLVLVAVVVTPAAADAEVFPEYHRPARDEHSAPKWREPEPAGLLTEDEYVERVNALRHGSEEDLNVERHRLYELQQEAMVKQQQQQQQKEPKQAIAAAKASQQVGAKLAQPLPIWLGLAPGLQQREDPASPATPVKEQPPPQAANLATQTVAPKERQTQQPAPQAPQGELLPDSLTQQPQHHEEDVEPLKQQEDSELDEKTMTLSRALSQEPRIRDLDWALLRTFLGSGSERYLDQVMSILQQQRQPEDSMAVAIKNAVSSRQAELVQRQRELQRQTQQQQREQEWHQQMLLADQHEQLDPETARFLSGVEAQQQQLAQQLLEEQQQQQQQQTAQFEEPFTFRFNNPEQRNRFASSPAESAYYQQDPRLYMLFRNGGSQQPQDEPLDEGSAGSVMARGAGGAGLMSSELSDPMDDMVDENEDGYARVRVTPPVVPEATMRHQPQQSHQPKPTVTRDSKLEDRGANLEYPVVKKQLTFPKDHWFFGMDDVGKLAIYIGCSIAVSGLILGSIVWQYRLHRNAKAAADVEYPAYGVTGPNKDISPTGDRRLAQSAQMYHYQHQKQQILAMESRAAGGRRGSMSEAESEDENEEGDYTVYECPGLAPTQEMEVKNPLFQDDPTPATPAPGMGAEAGSDGDGLPEGGQGGRQTKKSSASSSSDKTEDKPGDKKTSSNGRPSGKPDSGKP